MNITLRNIKHFAAMSEETYCFTADIWIDGVKVGDARNEGHGGPTMIHPRELEARIDAYAKTLPPSPVPGLVEDDGVTPVTIEQNAEIIVGDLVTQWLIEKDVKRALSRKVCFLKNGKPGIFTLAFKGKDISTGVALLQKPENLTRFDVRCILNVMPFEGAVKAYATGGAL